MPPKKSKKGKAKKATKSKSTRVSQVQKTRVNVRVGGGLGGVMPAPIVYATYAPPPPANPTQFIFDNGLPPAPVKAAPVPLSSGGVTVKPKYPSRPQPHQGMSPLDKFFFDSARHRPPSEASLSSYDDLPRRAASKKSEQGANDQQRDASMRSEPLPRAAYEPQGEQLRRSERDYVPQEAPRRAASMGGWPPPRTEAPPRTASERPATASMKSEPREESMKSEPQEESIKSEEAYYMPQVPAEPPGTHHQRDSPSARAMSVDSSQVSGHTKARTPPRDGGSIHSSLPSVKSEQWGSKRGGALPGSSVGKSSVAQLSEQWARGSTVASTRSNLSSTSKASTDLMNISHGSIHRATVKSEQRSDGMKGSYYGSQRGPLSGGVSIKKESEHNSYGSNRMGSKTPSKRSGYTA